jgi:hypothetical protein
MCATDLRVDYNRPCKPANIAKTIIPREIPPPPGNLWKLWLIPMHQIMDCHERLNWGQIAPVVLSRENPEVATRFPQVARHRVEPPQEFPPETRRQTDRAPESAQCERLTPRSTKRQEAETEGLDISSPCRVERSGNNRIALARPRRQGIQHREAILKQAATAWIGPKEDADSLHARQTKHTPQVPKPGAPPLIHS